MVLIVGPPVRPSAAWVLPAGPSAVSQLRRRATEFASMAGPSAEVTQAIALAVSETVTNAVVHAYDREDRGQVRVSCQVDGERFIVEVADEGAGIGRRRESPGIGHGLAMVGALALALDVATGRDGRGTAVTMAFGHAPALAAPPGLELLCVLALETVADVSCVDLVHEGVLRRVAAEVADDAALTSWLRAAVPPAKPGTATWSALREGGARLVVHDPTVPRSPGGTGERLNLTWCGHRLSRRGTNRARARSEAGAGRTPASGHSRGRGYTRGTCSGRAQFSRRANARFAGTRAASRPARWSQRVDLASAGRRGLDRARRVPASTSSNSRSVFPSRRSRPRRHACSRSTAARDPCASAAGPRMTGACIRATAGH
jgi:serine/threonine-protein kinase RsbW